MIFLLALEPRGFTVEQLKIQILLLWPKSPDFHSSVAWTNGRVTLEERGRFHMKNTPKEAIVEVQDCKIADSGNYEVIIHNENGEIKVDVPVKIVGRTTTNDHLFSWNKCDKTRSWTVLSIERCGRFTDLFIRAQTPLDKTPFVRVSNRHPLLYRQFNISRQTKPTVWRNQDVRHRERRGHCVVGITCE